MRKEAVFYYPQIQHIFHVKESKELNWINLLQDSYLGARYKEDYFIREKDCTFLKEKIECIFIKVKTDLFQCLAK